MNQTEPNKLIVSGRGFFALKGICPHSLTHWIRLRSVQTHISKQIRIEMCVCTLLKANPMGRRVRAHALKGKENFTHCFSSKIL